MQPFTQLQASERDSCKQLRQVTRLCIIGSGNRFEYNPITYTSESICPDVGGYTVFLKHPGEFSITSRVPYCRPARVIKDSTSFLASPELWLSGLFYSTVHTYFVSGHEYVVYKHIKYNCYDTFCSAKHNHISVQTGMIYFSPEYGVLLDTYDSSEVHVLGKIRNEKIPSLLIEKLMQEAGIGKPQIDTWKKFFPDS